MYIYIYLIKDVFGGADCDKRIVKEMRALLSLLRSGISGKIAVRNMWRILY